MVQSGSEAAVPLGDFHANQQIMERAERTKKPLVIEKLDFKKKKASLAEKGKNKFSRLLSGFAYELFFQF